MGNIVLILTTVSAKAVSVVKSLVKLVFQKIKIGKVLYGLILLFVAFFGRGPNPPGPPLPPVVVVPVEVRIQGVDEALESTRLLLSERESEFFTRINRIGLLGNSIPKNGPLRKGLIKYMDVSIGEHQAVIASKAIPRLYVKIALLEEARVKLQEEQEN